MPEARLENNLLCIIMEFPPFSSAGVFRPLRFLNGLVEKGIQPIVLTFEFDGQLKNGIVKQDIALLDKVDKRIIVYRIPLKDMNTFKRNRVANFVSTFFNTSDNFAKAWEDNLFSCLPEIIKKHQPKKLFVTAPPFSALPLALKVSTKYNLELFVDMRDAWAKLSMSPLGSYFHYIYKRQTERRVFKHAKVIITVTPQLKLMFQETHPRISKDKFQLIYNSMDDFTKLDVDILSKKVDSAQAFHICYTGSFYYSPESILDSQKKWWKKKGHRKFQYTPVKEDWLYRSPYFFFNTLNELFIKNRTWQKKIFFNFIGVIPNWLNHMVQEFKLEKNIILHDFKPIEKTIELLKQFDLLLTTSEKVKDKPHYCLPSKLFTYLESGKPVIGFVTEGVQAEFIKEGNIGIVLNPDQLQESVLQLEQILLKGFSAKANMTYLNKFSTQSATTSLIKILGYS